jgi:small conductance mechanosensitive channel
MEDFQLTLDWVDRDIVSVLFGILLGVVIFIIGRWVARLVSRFAARAMERREVDPLVIQFAKVLIYTGLLVAVLISALDAAGIHTTSLTALLASAGLAIGLAVKDALSNFASGVMILLTKPYGKDDYVEAAGTGGTVEEVSIFNTVLRTPDNIQVIVPNAQVTNDTIKNYSANDTRRIDIVAGIGYEDNIGQARDTLMDIMTGHELVLAGPAPTVDVLELADSSVNLAVRCWANTDDYWPVRCDVMEQIKTRFDAAGISMPYPQREVTIRSQNGQGVG